MPVFSSDMTSIPNSLTSEQSAARPHHGTSGFASKTTISVLSISLLVRYADEIVFLALQIAGGHVRLPLVLHTIALSSQVRQHPVFVNFCVLWIISSVVFSLL